MIILFDLDSTLVDGEGCDWLAHKKGVGDVVRSITQQTMDGSLDFDTAFPYKTKLIAPSIHELEELGAWYCGHLIDGIPEILQRLSDQGHTLGILTQGYSLAANALTTKLPITQEYIWGLEFEHDQKGNFLSFPDQILKKENGKGVIISHLKDRNPNEKIMFLGDSRGDYINGKNADIFVGRGVVTQRDKVKRNSQWYITNLEQFKDFLNTL